MTATTGRTGSAPTLEDVARKAGVSLATASRVLNGSTRKVADAYRERVEAAAKGLGYSPNLSAQATARGTSNVVTLLVADIADPYFGQIAAGVSRGAVEAGLLLNVAVSGRDPQRELEQVRAARGQRPRAVILATSRSGESLSPELSSELRAIRSAGSAVVALGPGADEIPAVMIDNVGGASALGRSMGNRGYRHAVVVAAAEGIRTSDDRVAGFSTGFAAVGGRVDAVHRGEFTRESGAEIISVLLRRGALERGTLVFAVSDIIALGVMSALRQGGRAIGAEIAVAGFDDIAIARDITPPLTTVRVPLERVGYRAIRMALDGVEPARRDGSAEVVLRESTPVRS